MNENDISLSEFEELLKELKSLSSVCYVSSVRRSLCGQFLKAMHADAQRFLAINDRDGGFDYIEPIFVESVASIYSTILDLGICDYVFELEFVGSLCNLHRYDIADSSRIFFKSSAVLASFAFQVLLHSKIVRALPLSFLEQLQSSQIFLDSFIDKFNGDEIRNHCSKTLSRLSEAVEHLSTNGSAPSAPSNTSLFDLPNSFFTSTGGASTTDSVSPTLLSNRERVKDSFHYLIRRANEGGDSPSPRKAFSRKQPTTTTTSTTADPTTPFHPSLVRPARDILSLLDPENVRWFAEFVIKTLATSSLPADECLPSLRKFLNRGSGSAGNKRMAKLQRRMGSGKSNQLVEQQTKFKISLPNFVSWFVKSVDSFSFTRALTIAIDIAIRKCLESADPRFKSSGGGGSGAMNAVLDERASPPPPANRLLLSPSSAQPLRNAPTPSSTLELILILQSLGFLAGSISALDSDLQSTLPRMSPSRILGDVVNGLTLHDNLVTVPFGCAFVSSFFEEIPSRVRWSWEVGGGGGGSNGGGGEDLRSLLVVLIGIRDSALCAAGASGFSFSRLLISTLLGDEVDRWRRVGAKWHQVPSLTLLEYPGERQDEEEEEVQGLDESSSIVDERFVFHLSPKLDRILTPYKVPKSRIGSRSKGIPNPKRVEVATVTPTPSTPSTSSKPPMDHLSLKIRHWFFHQHSDLKPLVNALMSSIEKNAVSVSISSSLSPAETMYYIQKCLKSSLPVTLPSNTHPAVVDAVVVICESIITSSALGAISNLKVNEARKRVLFRRKREARKRVNSSSSIPMVLRRALVNEISTSKSRFPSSEIQTSVLSLIADLDGVVMKKEILNPPLRLPALLNSLSSLLDSMNRLPTGCGWTIGYLLLRVGLGVQGVETRGLFDLLRRVKELSFFSDIEYLMSFLSVADSFDLPFWIPRPSQTESSSWPSCVMEIMLRFVTEKIVTMASLQLSFASQYDWFWSSVEFEGEGGSGDGDGDDEGVCPRMSRDFRKSILSWSSTSTGLSEQEEKCFACVIAFPD